MANIARCTSVESLELHRATLLAKVQNPFEAPTAHRVLMGRDGDSCPDDAVIGSAMALQRMDWHDPPIPSLPPLSLSPAHPFLLVAFAGFARRSLSHSSPILCIASPGVTLGRSQLALPVDTRELLEMALDGRVKVCQHHSLPLLFSSSRLNRCVAPRVPPGHAHLRNLPRPPAMLSGSGHLPTLLPTAGRCSFLRSKRRSRHSVTRRQPAGSATSCSSRR